MGGEMNAKYASVDGRKVVYSSINPIKLLRNANVFTIVAIVLIAGVTTGIVFAVRGIVKGIRERKLRRAA